MIKKITIKRRVGQSWEAVYPETTIDQVVGVSTAAKNLLDKTFANTEDALITIDTNNQYSHIDLSDVAERIGAATAGHTHTLSDLSNWQSTMNQYADLVNGEVPGNQLPSWVIGGLKITGTITAEIDIDDAFRQTHFGIHPMLTDEQVKFHAGKYLIIEPANGALDVTLTIKGTNVVNGEEGSGEISGGDTIKLEAGDWLVFRERIGVNYYFDIINNTYERASEDVYGTVKLSQAVNRANLGTTNTKAVTEGVLKNVMKKIHYSDTEPTTDVKEGDLFFHIMGEVTGG